MSSRTEGNGLGKENKKIRKIRDNKEESPVLPHTRYTNQIFYTGLAGTRGDSWGLPSPPPSPHCIMFERGGGYGSIKGCLEGQGKGGLTSLGDSFSPFPRHHPRCTLSGPSERTYLFCAPAKLRGCENGSALTLRNIPKFPALEIVAL